MSKMKKTLRRHVRKEALKDPPRTYREIAETLGYPQKSVMHAVTEMQKTGELPRRGKGPNKQIRLEAKEKVIRVRDAINAAPHKTYEKIAGEQNIPVKTFRLIANTLLEHGEIDRRRP